MSVLLAGRKTTGEEVEMGWAGWAALEELGQVSGRQVSGWASLFFIFYFCSVFLLLISFAIVLNLNKFKQCQKLL